MEADENPVEAVPRAERRRRARAAARAADESRAGMKTEGHPLTGLFTSGLHTGRRRPNRAELRRRR